VFVALAQAPRLQGSGNPQSEQSKGSERTERRGQSGGCRVGRRRMPVIHTHPQAADHACGAVRRRIAAGVGSQGNHFDSTERSVSSNDASTCRHALVSSACVRAAPWPTPLERNAAARDRGAEDRCGPREGEKRRRRGGGCGGGPAGTRQTCRDSSTAAILKAVVPHCPHLQEMHATKPISGL